MENAQILNSRYDNTDEIVSSYNLYSREPTDPTHVLRFYKIVILCKISNFGEVTDITASVNNHKNKQDVSFGKGKFICSSIKIRQVIILVNLWFHTDILMTIQQIVS